MRVGTKSVLFGYHAFWLHPFFVAWGWWHLYGFRRQWCRSAGVQTHLLDWRLWACFFVHDLGYIGTPNMDGEEGERHPYLGARIVERVFRWDVGLRWKRFVLFHSRFLAKKSGTNPSLLCHADKLSIYLTPSWIAVPMMRLSGEIKEYRARETRPEQSKGWKQEETVEMSDWEWWREVRRWCRAYAEEHKTGKQDDWTRT